MPDMNGEDLKLDDMQINLNISGGTIYGNIYGGGYGWSDRLEEEQLATDAGYVYGDVTMNITGVQSKETSMVEEEDMKIMETQSQLLQHL